MAAALSVRDRQFVEAVADRVAREIVAVLDLAERITRLEERTGTERPARRPHLTIVDDDA
jgi:hypothetical protein